MARYLGDEWMLPQIDELNEAWFTSGRIRVQSCESCGALQHPPDEVCGSCQGTQLSWRDCSGEGHVESAVAVHHPVHPALTDALPYVIAVVSLDDAPGVNAIGNIVNREPGQVEIGQAVRAVFEEVTDPDGGEPLRIPQWEVI